MYHINFPDFLAAVLLFTKEPGRKKKCDIFLKSAWWLFKYSKTGPCLTLHLTLHPPLPVPLPACS